MEKSGLMADLTRPQGVPDGEPVDCIARRTGAATTRWAYDPTAYFSTQTPTFPARCLACEHSSIVR
jgi:hypothetical protein